MARAAWRASASTVLQAVRAEGSGGLLVVDVDRAQRAGAAPSTSSARGERSGMQTIVRRSMRMTLWAWPSEGSATALPVATVSPVSSARRTTEVERPVISSGEGGAAPPRPTRTRRPATDGMAGGVRASPSTRSRKPRSARVICMTASSTCSRTWLRTRVELRACTRERRSCCCSIQGSSAICSVAPSPADGGELQGDVAELDLRALRRASLRCTRAELT